VARAGGTVDELTHLPLDYVRRVWASASTAVNDSSGVKSCHDA
jgi:hypothetical protein